MTTQVLQFVELSDKDRKTAKPLGEALGKLGKGDRVEVRVRRKSGKDEVVSLPPKAAALLEAAVERLLQGKRVVLLAGDIEISPNEAAAILSMSRPLVVHRMDLGDLPFHYVGKHRRAKLTDVLAFKKQVDAQQAAMKKLTELGEELWEQYGV